MTSARLIIGGWPVYLARYHQSDRAYRLSREPGFANPGKPQPPRLFGRH